LSSACEGGGIFGKWRVWDTASGLNAGGCRGRLRKAIFWLLGLRIGQSGGMDSRLGRRRMLAKL
jgi:hypothetical protein